MVSTLSLSSLAAFMTPIFFVMSAHNANLEIRNLPEQEVKASQHAPGCFLFLVHDDDCCELLLSPEVLHPDPFSHAPVPEAMVFCQGRSRL